METFLKYWWILAITAIIVIIIIFRKQIFFWNEWNKKHTTYPEQAPSIIGKTIKVMDKDGTYAFDLDANDCLVQKNPMLFLPYGDTSTIIETKKSNCPGFAPATPLMIRTEKGWFGDPGNGKVIQII